MKTIEELANLGAAAAYAERETDDTDISVSPVSSFWEADRAPREAFAAAVRDAVLADESSDLRDLKERNERQYQSFKEIANLLGIADQDQGVSSISSAIERLLETVAQLREQLTEAEDEVASLRTDRAASPTLTAAVPTWRPIAELLRTSKAQHVYWDGQVMWEGSVNLVHNATHFLAPPPKPDPFEVWWATQIRAGKHKAGCREAWNAAREAKA